MKTSLNFFLLFNSIKNIASAIATTMMISADTNKFIPQKTRNLDSSKVENGDITMEATHKKHSTNQPLIKPIMNGEIKVMIFFINFHLIIWICVYILT